MLHLPEPSVGSLVDGTTNTGPAPSVNPVTLRGEKKKEVVTSLMPKVASSPAKSGGWLTSGMMIRVIMFQSELSSNGMTGWTLRMNRVSSEGPTFCSQLNWNGTLTRSEIGFDSFLASSAVSSAAAGLAACWAYPIEDVTVRRQTVATALPK